MYFNKYKPAGGLTHAGTGKTVIVNSGLAWQIVIDDPELARKVMVFKSLEEVDAEIDDDAK